VKQGDLLAQIDPRPFEVQLAQAEGQLAKDQAPAQERRSLIWIVTSRPPRRFRNSILLPNRRL